MRNNTQQNESASQHRPGKFRLGKTLGITMVLVGVVLLTLVGAYYAYSASARSQLDKLNHTVTSPAQPVLPSLPPAPLPPAPTALSLASTSEPPSAPSSGKAESASLSVTTATVATKPAGVVAPPQPAQQSVPVSQESAALPATSFTQLYPGTQIHPKFWTSPIWSGGEPYSYSPLSPGNGLPDGYRVMSADDALRRGHGALTSRIAIPLINVDSETKELAIVDLGDSRSYETPKHLVGHIPQSSNPGETGNAWYFGHLESPIKGEGNVFHRLPDIPDLLRDGDDVFVELENADGSVFLYEVTRTEVIHEDSLELYGSDVAQITLVACVPRFVYDHRIVVTAELVGVKDVLGAVN